MVDITKVLCDSSQSLEKLRQYLHKSSVELVACRKVSASSTLPTVRLETLPIDTVKGQEETARTNVPTGYFDRDDSSPSVNWNLNSTLNVKRILKQKGFTQTACNRNCDIRLKRPSVAEGDMRSTYFGTVLEIELCYHSDKRSGILLCSQSNLLRDKKWVDRLERYLAVEFKDAPTVFILWADVNNPGHTELRKVV